MSDDTGAELADTAAADMEAADNGAMAALTPAMRKAGMLRRAAQMREAAKWMKNPADHLLLLELAAQYEHMAEADIDPAGIAVSDPPQLAAF